MIAIAVIWLFGLQETPPQIPERGPPLPDVPYRVAAAHILILHQGAFDPGTVRRDREAARTLARQVHGELDREGADFDAVCRRRSEDRVRRETGGYLGVFTPGMLSDDMREVEEALFSLSMGEVSPVVESPLGFHILRRVPIREWRGAHILIQHRGARKAPKELERTEEKALALARRLLEEARRPDADFADLARKYSDAPDRVRGGDLGLFSRSEVIRELEEAIASTAVDRVSGPVKSPLGYHVVRREPIRRLRLAEILVAPEDGAATPDARRRALEEARAVRREASRSREEFARLARERSDHPRADFAGDLGVIPLGSLPPELARAASRLKPWEISPVLETAKGFHILQRWPEPRPSGVEKQRR